MKAFLLIFLLFYSISAREWTDKKGQTIEAEMVKYQQGYVFLKRADGKSFKVPVNKLSEKDVNFIKNEMLKKRRALGFKDSELFPIQVNDKFGYIDSMGNVIIEPKYTFAEYFSEGFAYVTLNGKSGFINSKGEEKFDFRKFERIYSDLPFPKGDNKKFVSGLIPFKSTNGKCGYLNKKGGWAIKPEYISVTPFSEGFAVVERHAPGQNDRGGFPNYEIINTKGEKLVDLQFRGIGRFSNGLIPVQIREENSKYGVLNTSGEWVVKPKYEHIFNFEGGFAEVWGGKDGSYINTEGKEVFGKQYDQGFHTGFISGSVFRCGILVDGFNGKINFYSSEKLELSVGPLDYFFINHFSENLASFQKEEKGLFGYLDLNGKVVVKPMFTKASDFKHGLALVEGRGYRMYIDKKGKVIWKTKL